MGGDRARSRGTWKAVERSWGLMCSVHSPVHAVNAEGLLCARNCVRNGRGGGDQQDVVSAFETSVVSRPGNDPALWCSLALSRYLNKTVASYIPCPGCEIGDVSGDAFSWSLLPSDSCPWRSLLPTLIALGCPPATQTEHPWVHKTSLKFGLADELYITMQRVERRLLRSLS